MSKNYLSVAENKTGENIVISHFKSCSFYTKNICYIYVISFFLRKGLKLSSRGFSVKCVFCEAVKNSLYTQSTGFLTLYQKNSLKILSVMDRLYLGTSGLNKNVLATYFCPPSPVVPLGLGSKSRKTSFSYFYCAFQKLEKENLTKKQK